MVTDRQNCWEFQGCGRGPGETGYAELGPCPAATEVRTDGLNSGRYGGRACWAVAGSLSPGRVAGSVARATGNCMTCPFYRQVLSEEGEAFVNTWSVRELLK